MPHLDDWGDVAAPRSGPTVLVAEHDPWLRSLLAELLSAEDYVVLPASNGATTARLAEQCRPAAILLDPTLPELSGRDLLACLEGQTATRGIPIVLLTTPDSPSLDDRSGVVSVLRKPFDVDEIVGQVRRVASAATSHA